MTRDERRFQLAKAVLTGLLSGGLTSDKDVSPDNTWPENYARLAVKYADGLLAELEKPSAPGLLDACKHARELGYALGDRNTPESRDLFEMTKQCDAAITAAEPESGPWFDDNLPFEREGKRRQRAETGGERSDV